MNIIAYMWAYNEEDVIGFTVSHLVRQGIDVHILDNWSTDATFNIVTEFGRRFPLRVSVSRWPLQGPVKVVSWHDMLRHTELMALLGPPGWVMHHDADEIRRSHHPEETLRDTIERIASYGVTAINHDLRVYRPNETYQAGMNLEAELTEEEPKHVDYSNGHVKCWRQMPGCRVDLAKSGGHWVNFPGIVVGAERLVLKHYPFRTAAQKARKLAERLTRWAPVDRARGWHTQYEASVKRQAGTKKNPRKP